MRSIPEPWASALVRANLTDPRSMDVQIPSLGQLAVAVGVHTSTISAMVRGTKDTRPEIVAAVADALGEDVVTVSGWVRQARDVREPYRVPAEVNQLTEREQDAVTEIIRAMAAARKQAMGNAQHPAPIVTTESVPGRPVEGSSGLGEGERATWGKGQVPRPRRRAPSRDGVPRSEGTNHEGR